MCNYLQLFPIICHNLQLICNHVQHFVTYTICNCLRLSGIHLLLFATICPKYATISYGYATSFHWIASSCYKFIVIYINNKFQREQDNPTQLCTCQRCASGSSQKRSMHCFRNLHAWVSCCIVSRFSDVWWMKLLVNMLTWPNRYDSEQLHIYKPKRSSKVLCELAICLTL